MNATILPRRPSTRLACALSFVTLVACGAPASNTGLGTTGIPTRMAPQGDRDLTPGGTHAIGGTCQALGGSVNVSQSRTAATPLLALDSRGLPVVAWLDATSGSAQVFVRRFDGQNWRALGGSETAAGISQEPGVTSHAMALDAADKPCVAWTASQQSFGVELRCFDGSAWADLGGSAKLPGINDAQSSKLGSVAVTLDDTGKPYIAWSGFAADPQNPNYSQWSVLHRAWNGHAWPQSNALSGLNLDLHNAVLPGRGPIFVVVEGWTTQNGTAANSDIFVFQDNGGALTPFGASADISNTPAPSQNPAVAVSSAGQPTVVWAEQTASGAFAVSALRFDGNAWKSLNSGACGFVNCTAGSASNPKVALTPAGEPVVVWQQTHEGHNVVYLLVHQGEAWVEVNGSASGEGVGGIAHAANASAPTVAVDGSGIPAVAWQGDSDVFACQYR